MPFYDYACDECEKYFEQMNSMANHAEGTCPTCGAKSRQVLLQAPPLMVEAMADAGFPGAFHTSGDRIEKQHRKAGQYHSQTAGQAADADAQHRDFVKSVTTTKAG
jgi:putative FmdB family regulatory protein